MSAIAVLLLTRKGLFTRKKRKTGTWLILSFEEGRYRVESEHNYRPSTIPSGSRLVREYR